MQVQGVLEDGVLVQAQQRVLERVQQHEELERVPAQVPELVREPGRRHSLWLRWRGSKKSFSSIRRRSFSKPHQQSCANC